jgi:hypothetical protein
MCQNLHQELGGRLGRFSDCKEAAHIAIIRASAGDKAPCQFLHKRLSLPKHLPDQDLEEIPDDSSLTTLLYCRPL